MNYTDTSAEQKNVRHAAVIEHLRDHQSTQHFADFGEWGDLTDAEIDAACGEKK